MTIITSDLQAHVVGIVADMLGDVAWSITVRDSAGSAIAATGADLVQPIASVGKLLLLIEVANQVNVLRVLDLDDLVPRPAPVGGSGLWQHLLTPTLAVGDAATLVGTVSDNLASNALLLRVGLANVADTASRLGFRATVLHDQFRDHRFGTHPTSVATGSTNELSLLLHRLSTSTLLGGSADAVMRGWLAGGVDMSMIAGGTALHPLHHVNTGDVVSVVHKTGFDHGIRAEAGTITGPEGMISYAATATWDHADYDCTNMINTAMLSMGERITDIVNPI